MSCSFCEYATEDELSRCKRCDDIICFDCACGDLCVTCNAHNDRDLLHEENKWLRSQLELAMSVGLEGCEFYRGVIEKDDELFCRVADAFEDHNARLDRIIEVIEKVTAVDALEAECK
jgi:hypothetical protein